MIINYFNFHSSPSKLEDFCGVFKVSEISTTLISLFFKHFFCVVNALKISRIKTPHLLFSRYAAHCFRHFKLALVKRYYFGDSFPVKSTVLSFASIVVFCSVD